MRVSAIRTASTQFIVFSIIISAVAFAGWTPDIRLTYRHFEMEPQIAARSDTVHVVWQQIAGPEHISYMRSIDGGNTWSQLQNLEDTNHWAIRQDFWLDGDRLFVGWEDEVQYEDPLDIGFNYSFGGDNWLQHPGYVFHHGVPMFDVGTACYHDSIYVVYLSAQHDIPGYFPIKFLYSSDLGNTWSSELTVGHLVDYTNFLHVARCAGTIYVIWAADSPPVGGIHEVMAVVSHDGGLHLSNVVQLSSPDSAVAQNTCIACDEESGNFAVGWMDAGDWYHYPGDLYVRITTDGGYVWMPESHVTYDRWVMNSSIAIKGDSLWAVWDDRDPAYGMGNDEICFSKSTNLGASWSPYERLTYNPEHSLAPWIAYDHGKLHVVWYNDNPPPDSGMDIYYMRYEPEVGIGNEPDGNLPDRITLSAYPNPFNSAVILSYTDMKGGDIAIYDIQGKLIKSYNLEGGGDGKINWDATDASGKKVSSGIYFAKAASQNNSAVIKLIFLK